jgi:hypothetical protein
MQSDLPTDTLGLGRWIGQSQAFGLIASKCSAAQAQCLQSIRGNRLYESLGVTWEDFCAQHAGISRAYADQLIRNLEEFGDAYFRLSEILHISEPAYRAISPAIHGDAIEFEGQTIPLVPENAARIRQAVARLRADLKRTKTAHWFPETYVMQHELDLALDQMEDINRRSDRPEDLTGVQNLCNYAITRLQWIAKENAAAQSSLSPPAAT